ncbi:hypothetical protein LOK49_LG04G01748 [Camellia lanceoleosa]|uniref:Uncharacterized protein n=1 Tax=Camellia lanceoleosa TaxID=1840588 RepID=A0ACC0I7W8_9ERIC|nr:hypothetical protein LOK49_LG04G01748 [Camellia lanceoleosa]
MTTTSSPPTSTAKISSFINLPSNPTVFVPFRKVKWCERRVEIDERSFRSVREGAKDREEARRNPSSKNIDVVMFDGDEAV